MNVEADVESLVPSGCVVRTSPIDGEGRRRFFVSLPLGSPVVAGSRVKLDVDLGAGCAQVIEVMRS